jgi:hypothetical protein
MEVFLLIPGNDSIGFLIIGLICFGIAASGKVLDGSDRR